MKTSAFLGLRTVVYRVPDLTRAKQWYSQALGVEPYFDQPFYVGFNVGGFELGLDPSESGSSAGAGGATAYWGVTDIAKEWDRLIRLGARSVTPVMDVGEGIKVGTLADPFGNLVGVIENPHFPNTA